MRKRMVSLLLCFVMLADDFEEDKRWGYPRWKVLLGRLTGKGKG